MIAQHDSTNGLLRLLYDGHGSTRAILNPAAALVQRYAYDAYGVMLTAPGLTTAAAALTRLLYSGEHTNANGTQYLRARWYDPSTGRFNRLDPFAGNASDPLSLHKYLYTHGNPAMGIDPSGLFTMSEMNVTIGNMTRIALRVGRPVAIAYDRYDTVRTASQIISNATKYGRFDGIGIAMLALQFLPMGGIVSKMGTAFGSAKRYVLTAGNGGGDAIRYFQNVYSDTVRHFGEATNGLVEIMGTTGAAFVATAKKFTNHGFRIGNTGLDGIFQDQAGRWIVVEAKGGLRGVRASSEQMGQAWIKSRVRTTIRFSRGHVDQHILDSLQAALDADDIQGMVVHTRIINGEVQSLGFELKEMAEIGINSWTN